MALSPEQYENQEFTVAFRGWKKEEVTAFLKARATDFRELQSKLDAAKAEVEEAKRSKEAAIAAAAQLPVPPALTATASEKADADKFNEMGDRIAGLLRVAEESAEKIKNEAEVDAEEMKTLAGMEAEELKADAQRILDEAHAEAEKIRSEADSSVAEMKTEVEEARANLDAELAEIREQTEADRKQAAEELAEAKAEVAELLAEARSQSEFIRHEADEIVRVKVRTDMETAEKRMRILQLTEQSSRDRLVAAQSELNAALEKLEAEPAPELDPIQADSVLEEAHDRATRELAAGGKTKAAAASYGGNSLDEVFEPQFYENPVSEDDADDSDDIDADDEVVTLLDTDADDNAGSKYEEAYGFSADSDDEVDAEDDADEVDAEDDADEVVAEDDDDEVVAEDDDDEVVAEDDDDEVVAEDDDDEVVAEDDDEVVSEDDDVVAEDDADEVVAEDADEVIPDELFDAQDVMDETPGVLIEDSISSLPDDRQSPLDSTEIPDDSGDLIDDELVPSVPAPPTESADAIPAALAGKPPAAPVETESKVLSDEDPLAKLVREAMQRAVDSARGDEG